MMSMTKIATKETHEINSVIMCSYYKIIHLERDTKAFTYALYRASFEQFTDLQHLNEKRIADQRRDIIKSNLLPEPILQQIQEKLFWTCKWNAVTLWLKQLNQW